MEKQALLHKLSRSDEYLYILVYLSVVITALLCLYPIHAAQANEFEQPRVGLVLSGGGAKGAAQVGVIRVLEEISGSLQAVTRGW